MLTYLLSGLALGLSAAAQPGPFQAYLLSRTMQNGWRRILPAALAPILSDGPIILLVVFMLTRLPPWLLRGVQVVGGVFILYLAWQAFLSFRSADFSAPSPASHAREPGRGPEASIVEAAVMNALNPGAYLFWGMVAGPVLLQGWRQSAVLGVSFLAGFYGTLVGGFALLIVLFATARHLGSRVTRALLGLSAVALAIFGAYQLYQGLLAAL